MNIILIAHNIRSCHNVGSILRSADGFGVSKLFLTGYSPYPELGSNDKRLPHLAAKLHKDIQKTALGAEKTVKFEYAPEVKQVIESIKADGYKVVGLEQDQTSQSLFSYNPPQKIAIVLGEEVNGIAPDIKKMLDEIVEIPMYGQKESFNVAVATGITLFRLRQASVIDN